MNPMILFYPYSLRFGTCRLNANYTGMMVRVVRSPKSVHVHHVHRMIFSDTFIRKTMKFNDENFHMGKFKWAKFSCQTVLWPNGTYSHKPVLYIRLLGPSCMRPLPDWGISVIASSAVCASISQCKSMTQHTKKPRHLSNSKLSNASQVSSQDAQPPQMDLPGAARLAANPNL